MGLLDKKKSSKKIKRGPSEIVAMDLGSSGLKVVRLRQGRDQFMVLGVDILPPVDLEQDRNKKERLKLPDVLVSNYAALSMTSVKSLVRMIVLTARADQKRNEAQEVREHFSLKDGYRMAHSVLVPARGKLGARVLAVAAPADEASAVVGLLPSGAPAPYSLEISGLSTLTAFENGPGQKFKDDTVCLIETGASCTYVSIMKQGIPVLVRKYEIGGEALIQHVAQRLGVEREMAMTIISDDAIDLSAMLHDTMGFVFRQFSISRDFVERREKCRIREVLLTGGMSISPFWRDAVSQAMSLDAKTWDPFDNMQFAPGALPDVLIGQKSRFASAVGAGLGVLLQS